MVTTLISRTLDRRLNVFPLTFSSDINFRYRIWNIDPIPKTPKLREKIRSYLWQKALKRPVFPRYEGSFTFGVADRGSQEIVKYVGEGDKQYVISPTDQYENIDLSTLTIGEADFVSALIQQEINLLLGRNSELSKGFYNNQYLLVRPDQPYTPTSSQHTSARKPETTVDILRGFSFRVAHFEEYGLCIVLDGLTTYIGQKTLAEYLRAEEDLPAHLEYEGGLSRWINDYGTRKQAVYIVAEMNKAIGEVILKDGKSIFDFLITSYPHLKNQVTGNDPAISAIYNLDDRNNEEKYYTVSASLLKPKFTNSSSEVKALHDTPAFPPDERFRRIQQFRKYFYGIRFAGKSVHVEEGIQSQRLVFPLPTLVYGNDMHLSIAPNADLPERSEWGSKKLQYLQNYGPQVRKDFNNPFLVYPVSLERDGLLDSFLEKTKALCKQYGWCDFEPELSSYADNAPSKSILMVKPIRDRRYGVA